MELNQNLKELFGSHQKATAENFALLIDEIWKLGAQSAYDLAVAAGFEGTEEEWLASLKGDKGDKGIAGDKGDQGASISTISFTKDETGLLTGGTATLTDGKTIDITIV